MNIKFSALFLVFALGSNLFAQKNIPVGQLENSVIQNDADKAKNDYVLNGKGLKNIGRWTIEL